MELIPIQQQLINGEEVNSVDARALHKSLGNKKQFANWVTYQITSLGLVKDKDYVTFNQKVKREDTNLSSTRTDYLFTLDIAKHIALASRTKEGKEIRAYFIEVEKRSHEHMPQAATMSLLTQMSETLNMMAKNQSMIISRVEALEQSNTNTQVLEDAFLLSTKDDSYSKEDEFLIMQLKSQGKSNDYIAAKLGRTNQAIRCKSTRLRSAYLASLIAKDIQEH